jgi:CubicO group peptidase (beta-lactamase class C family)
MQVTPTGEMYLGGGSYLRPRDFLKLGQLFLDDGSWHGRRILDAKWVAASLRPAASLQTAGDYAYGWHLASYAIGERRVDTFEAGGNGGQILVVAPALDLVALVTGGNYGDYRTWSAFHELLHKYVLAAAQ